MFSPHLLLLLLPLTIGIGRRSHPVPGNMKSQKISVVHDIRTYLWRVFRIWIWCFWRIFYVIENLTKWSGSSSNNPPVGNILIFMFLTFFSFQWCIICGRRNNLDFLPSQDQGGLRGFAKPQRRMEDARWM